MQKVILYQYYFRQLRYRLRYVADIAMKSTNTPYSHERKVKHVYKKPTGLCQNTSRRKTSTRHVTSLYRTNINI